MQTKLKVALTITSAIFETLGKIQVTGWTTKYDKRRIKFRKRTTVKTSSKILKILFFLYLFIAGMKWAM